MAQPLYFLPHLRQAAADSLPLRRSVLKERGLDGIFADVPFQEQPLHELPGRGPGKLPGCLLTYQTTTGQVPRRIDYRPAEQTWTPVGDGSLLWIGVDSAEPPTPEELQRVKVCRGYPITLGDGREWQVPVIRRSDPERPTFLPSAFVRNGAGTLVEQVRASYRSHWEAFADVAEWIYAGSPEGRFTNEQIVDLAIHALSINYRFGWHEQNLLQVVDSENFLSIVALAVDYPAFTDQKKMPAPSSAPGSPEGSPDTSPATAS
jgi:hypothetical protein